MNDLMNELQLNYLFQNFIDKFEILIVDANDFEIFSYPNPSNDQQIQNPFWMDTSLEDFVEFS